MSKNKILLLDSNSLMHRAYHALPNLKSSKGLYTGAVFGFLSILLRLIKEQQPTHIAAAFDLKGPTFRHEMYDGYKATRKPMDEELRQQVEPLKSLITAMGIKIVSMQGYEGDDILGTLAKRFDDECIIVTGDRDSFQLVSPTTRVFWTKRGVTDIEVYDEARLLQDGFTTSQFIDYKALMGDASDNIPGIAGVGEKTAKALLAEYGSLDSVLEHAAEIKGKVGQNVVNGREMALLSRRLARINTDVPVECTLDDISFTPIYSGEVKSKLMELEISSLMNRMTFDANEVTPEIKALEKTVVRLNSTEAIRETLKGESVAVYIDREISFATDSKTEYVIDCAEDLFSEGPYFDDALDCVRQCSRNMRLICYDYKTTSKKYGFENSEFFDVMIAAHLARESMPIKGLAQVLGAEGLENGAAELFAASEKLEAQLTEKGLKQLFYDVEQPLCVVLRNMEQRGVRVSMNKLKELEDKYGGIIDRLSDSIFEKAGCNFNISSPKQLGEVLFDKMGLPHGKKTKTGYSVSEDVLAGLAGKNPIVKDILEYRHYTKLQSTYVVGLQPLINRGRIHTDFNQCITTTGRLSSTNPNLQNIPTRSEEAKDIKGAFLPSEGNVLVSADYSQIELRLLAHMSGDEQLIEAFNKDDDIHAITASQILGIPLDAVTPEQRRDAKAVNFGIIYGISDFGLSEDLGVPVYMARDFIAGYFATYPKVKEYMDKCVEIAKEQGYVTTYLNRRRDIPELKATNYNVRSFGERVAMNMPLQGSASDIIKVAMLKVHKALKEGGFKAKLIMQVHDELIIDCPVDEEERVHRLLVENMQNITPDFDVKLIADCSSGKSWLEAK